MKISFLDFEQPIAELEAKRAQIDASLSELRMINERSRKTLEDKRKSDK